jgi:hypothetical protein
LKSEVNKEPLGHIWTGYLEANQENENDSIEDDLLIKPTGKTIADIVRMSPGALVWNHGEEFVERARAQPNEIRAPPMKELINILSILMQAFFAPIRDTSSVVWAGVNASMMKFLLIDHKSHVKLIAMMYIEMAPTEAETQVRKRESSGEHSKDIHSSQRSY